MSALRIHGFSGDYFNRFFFLSNLFDTFTIADLVQAQFLLARHGVAYSESNMLAMFEFDVLLDLAIKEEKSQIEISQASMSLPHLGAKRR